MNFRNFAPTVVLAIATLFLIGTSFGQQKDQQQTDQLETEKTETLMQIDSLPELPIGITSFGGAHCDGHLYVWGGHNGDAHKYYRSGQNAALYRLNLAEPKDWEKVHEEEQGRQGLAMVSHGGKLYRLGGFEALNKMGEDQDLHSVATFDMFDPAAGEWTALLDMPESRSSFDAVVVDDTLFVVGGWAIADGEYVWSETAWSIDLSNLKSEWKELPTPPFTRRALSVTHHNNKLYVIGGMQQKGGPTRGVAVFDIPTGRWSEGPELPGEEGREGFGNSSFNIGGQVCVTTYSGHVYRLKSDAQQWHHMGTLDTGRFFHRLLPISDEKFALVGGANMESGKNMEVEVISAGK